MCGGKPADPTPPPVQPLPAPIPMPVPSDVAPQQTSQQRRGQVSALKFGAMSTVKTSPQGVVGAGPDLSTSNVSGQKKVLGA